ncbi:MAG: CBS domain-containing protein [Nocardiaceae bacterium]|nr:CBS domain-containing protein [Nocardiaceae bacterium]
MKIADILNHKGTAVATVTPEATVTELLDILSDQNIGAVVVTDPSGVIGIVSERDVVRKLHDRGAAVLDAKVAEIMTTSVVVCSSGDTVDSLAETMTERHIRHMPVVDDGALAGIVSIGDVVKNRIAQLEDDRGYLEAYIQQG